MRDVITNESVVVAIKSQISSNLGDEAVILHLGKGAYYGVNEVGLLVWEKLQKPVKVKDIATEISHKYSVSKQQCDTDLMDLLKRMLRANLIDVKAT
jgi:hypothetical protein